MLLRFLVLAAFIALAAFLSVLADLDTAAVVAIMALAWLIAAAVEWLAWQPGVASSDIRHVPAEPAVPVVYAEPPVENGPEPDPDAERRERRSWRPHLRRRAAATDPEPGGAGHAPPENDAEPEAPSERPQLRPVEPAPAPLPPPQAPPADTTVVRMSDRRAPEPREWNLWDLESVAREETRADPTRRDEWSYLFLHLREFADAKGTLPKEFDPLVRESFGDLLEVHNLA